MISSVLCATAEVYGLAVSTALFMYCGKTSISMQCGRQETRTHGLGLVHELLQTGGNVGHRVLRDLVQGGSGRGRLVGGDGGVVCVFGRHDVA